MGYGQPSFEAIPNVQLLGAEQVGLLVLPKPGPNIAELT